ncbi:UNVERIFIED_CONTAM: hypothetical protein K2H54_036555 [Gekko kuhli]
MRRHCALRRVSDAFRLWRLKFKVVSLKLFYLQEIIDRFNRRGSCPCSSSTVISAVRLFETHPECKDAFFLFRDVDDFQQLKMSKELQAHGLR